MNHLSLIIKREYLNKVKNKAFIIMTFLSPLIMVGIFTLVAYLSQLNNDKVRTISVMDESGMFSDEFESDDNLKYHFISGSNLADAKKTVEESGDYGLLYIPDVESLDALSKSITFYSEDSPSFIVLDDIEDAIAAKANTLKLEEAGMDPEKIESLRIRIDTKLETFG
ncbi:MAG: ABC transporter permease, partial [Flavobacteriaceae bacterium]|nr:ABC transporter permease [Flavobacteriaceae bacterium]